MGWFPCFGKSHSRRSSKEKMKIKDPLTPIHLSSSDPLKSQETPSDGGSNQIAAQKFSFRELAVATRNFRADSLLGEGGFGRVYIGRLENSNQIVAIKQLDRNGLQGNREFLIVVSMLSLLHHPNLVNLIGYCADRDQRLLVHEYMPLGSLDDYLFCSVYFSLSVPLEVSTFKIIFRYFYFRSYNHVWSDLTPGEKRLDWNSRMKIAAGAAMGLEYLHEKASPQVIYRDLKCSNILLDEGYHPKLSDFGLVGPAEDNRVKGTIGYFAPEYALYGKLTPKSNVYSFGIVMLEIITGRNAIDNLNFTGESLARPLLKDLKKFKQLADPMLRGQFPMKGLYQASSVIAACVEEQPNMRPAIADVVSALSFIASQKYQPEMKPSPTSLRKEGDKKQFDDNEI